MRMALFQAPRTFILAPKEDCPRCGRRHILVISQCKQWYSTGGPAVDLPQSLPTISYRGNGHTCCAPIRLDLPYCSAPSHPAPEMSPPDAVYLSLLPPPIPPGMSSPA
ncbi:uncharacterized protein LACBIDRAFT_326098 [Laccaria bicolor S238N-H82]|uniref:Predicted protein n=1 Tax=Laccaria bicolor (strain S238N-H82 / ATCC MYA-4686) TaxID=486041 RepID=B0D7A4_LACBS|nr:uncharacterized protein LACBIDRAFT_326098 [Laccaria bicolor S238N-H82]EDR09619.1 predicted protein [Laccaria bicolor S238N-H82]|eukprot:XP_001879968.1 predicted protein [Laccaria bicolor S238N-H82]